MNHIDLVVMSWIGFDLRVLDSDSLCKSKQMIMFQRSPELRDTQLLILCQCFLNETFKCVFFPTQSEAGIYIVSSLKQRLSPI